MTLVVVLDGNQQLLHGTSWHFVMVRAAVTLLLPIHAEGVHVMYMVSRVIITAAQAMSTAVQGHIIGTQGAQVHPVKT